MSESEPNIRVWTDVHPFERCVICTLRGRGDNLETAHAWECRGGWALCKTHTAMFDQKLTEGDIKVRLSIDIPAESTAKVTVLPELKMLSD